MPNRKHFPAMDALRWTGENRHDMEVFLESPRNGFFQGGDLHLLYHGSVSHRVTPGEWVVRNERGEFSAVKDAVMDWACGAYEVARREFGFSLESPK